MPTYHQARPRLKVISYGHFGTPVYNSDTKIWSFARDPKKYHEVLPIGDTQDLLPATADSKEAGHLRQDAHGKEELYAKALQYEIDDVVRAYPELVAAEDLVNPLVRLSEGIISATSVYDPAVGALMDRGVISFTRDGVHEIMTLQAAPGGGGGESLRLAILKSQEYALDERDGSIESYVAAKEVGHWTGKGAPVMQILFATAATKTTKSNLLAVRLPGCTVIMYPRYRPTGIMHSGHQAEEPQSPSRVDPNILCEVRPEDTGGVLHADIAFNPWNNREFAIINQNGDWCTFHVKRIHEKRPIYVAVRVNSGFAPGHEDEGPERDDHREGQEAQDDAQSSAFNATPAEMESNHDINQHSSVKCSFDASRDEGSAISDVDGIPGPSKLGLPMVQEARMKVEARSATSISDRDVSDEHQARGEEAHVLTDGIKPCRRKEDAPSAPRAKQDGWARITYALNSGTLVACTRREAYIFDTDTGESFEFPNLFPDHKPVSWLLDLKPCSRHFDHVFFLTGYSICLVRIWEAELREPGRNSKPRKAEVVLSALHFRDPKDISLRLNVAADGDVYLVTVSSSYNDRVSCVFFTLSSEQDSQPTATEVIPFSLRADTRAPGMKALQTTVRTLNSPDSLFTEDVDAVTSWFSLEILQQNMAVCQAFCFARSSLDEPIPPVPYEMAASGHQVLEHMANHLVMAPSHNIAAEEQNGKDRFGKDIVVQPKQTYINHWNAAAAIINQDHAVDEQVSIRDYLASFIEHQQTATIETLHTGPQPMPTIFELIGKDLPRFRDARDTSFAVEDVIPLDVVQLRVNGLDIRRDDGATAGEVFDIVYERIEARFVTPSNSALPTAFSQERVQIAISAAAEVLLSSCTLKIQDTSQRHETGSKDEEGQAGSHMASRPSQSQSRSQSQTDNLLSIRPQSPYCASPDALMGAIIGRLSRHVKLTLKPAQDWDIEPMAVLDHWEMGTDPCDYSYAGASERLEAEKEFAGLSEAEKKRVLRKQEKAQRKRDKELRREVRLGIGSSQAPMVSSQVPGIASQVQGGGAHQRSTRGPQREGRMNAGFGSQTSSGQAKVRKEAKETSAQGDAAMATPSSQVQHGESQISETFEVPPAAAGKRKRDEREHSDALDVERDQATQAQQQPTPAATSRSQQHTSRLGPSQLSQGSQISSQQVGSQRSKRRRAGF